MYTKEQKLSAIGLFIKYDFSPASVINELGYPCRMTLCNWYREYLENGHGFPEANPYERCDAEQKWAAVDYFFEHGRCLARTCRLLGHPSKELLARWVDELEPGRRPRRNSTAKIPEGAKGRAVVDLVTRKGAAKDIADELGVERATLYNWKRRLLSEELPCKLPKNTDARAIEELGDHAARLRSDIDRLELQKPSWNGRWSFWEKTEASTRACSRTGRRRPLWRA